MIGAAPRRVQGTVWASTVDPADRAALDPGVPADLDRHPDVLVVGGGVIGLATAVFCRRVGVGRVLVIEAARLAAAASGGAGGSLAPGLHQLSDPPAFVVLARASLALYRQLEQDWDRTLGLEWTEGLLVLPDGPPAGLRPWPGVELLDSGRVAELVPELAPMPAGLLAHDQARVHPLRLAAALARQAGGVATGVAMTDLEVAGGRILRVLTTAGELHPGVVMFATGLAPEPWVQVPQRLVKGHLIATRAGRLPPGLRPAQPRPRDRFHGRWRAARRRHPRRGRPRRPGPPRGDPGHPAPTGCAAPGRRPRAGAPPMVLLPAGHRRRPAGDRPGARPRHRLGERRP